jgi:glycosyltransferase involved in cell wall biosynthesis
VSEAERRVLHVLPHPGGGGEHYVDLLGSMDGFASEKAFVAPSARPSPAVIVGSLRAQLAARRFDLLHAHGEVASGLCLGALALRPSIITINGLHLLRRARGWKGVAAAANLRLVVRAASATVCVSESEAAEVWAVVGGRSSVVLVHNGIDPLPEPSVEERRAARERLDVSEAETVGVYLAALDPHKEPLTAARAAVEARSAGAPIRLLFAGEGPMRSELESLARENQAIRVLGFRNDVPQILAAADFFVLPSVREGLSFALLEAMSIGLPPVVSDAPGNRDAVGDAGVIVPQGNVRGFADAFARLAADTTTRRSLGARARERVIERFGRAAMVERTRAVYQQALG